MPTPQVDHPAPTGPARAQRTRGKRKQTAYPLWFYLPAGVFYLILFLIPTIASFYFAFTRWNLFEAEWIGLDNFEQFFREPALVRGFINTFIFGFVTSGLKVVLGLMLAILLTSQIIARGYLRSVVFFPSWSARSASASPSEC